MRPMTKAVAVTLVQILLISSLGAKLLYDRHTRPRAWFKTRQYDPNLPIRGRYMSLQIELKDSRSPEEIEARFGNEIRAQENLRTKYPQRGPFLFGRECGDITVHDGVPTAVFEQSRSVKSGWRCENLSFIRQRSGGAANDTTLRLNDAVLFFIPDTAEDPSRAHAREEVWVLATIPRKGPPRPITLGIKRSDESNIRPLKLD